MFAALLPLFDEKQAVKALSLFTQKENMMIHPMLAGTASNSGIGQIGGLEVIENTGIDTLSQYADIFIPVNGISLFADIEKQCTVSQKRIVLLMDDTVKPEEKFISRINELKNQGYRFAIRKIYVADFENYRSILSLLDFILLDYKRIEISKAKVYFSSLFPHLKLVATNINNQETFDKLVQSGGYSLYEGDFYRLPITKGEAEIAPVKGNYIELINAVNAEDFELTQVADILGRDTALVVSLLKMVNNMTVNGGITTIRHATAMLGQRELKKWINTAVTGMLCKDKPSELMRISLIRAKFCENLAPMFSMAGVSSELFLTGLFSVIDIILNQTMAEALTAVHVSKPISDALVRNQGDYSEILNFVKSYETANWAEVSRIMVLENIDMDEVYKLYLDTLKWYKDLFK